MVSGTPLRSASSGPGELQVDQRVEAQQATALAGRTGAQHAEAVGGYGTGASH